jgi:hypothetical protein
MGRVLCCCNINKSLLVCDGEIPKRIVEDIATYLQYNNIYGESSKIGGSLQLVNTTLVRNGLDSSQQQQFVTRREQEQQHWELQQQQQTLSPQNLMMNNNKYQQQQQQEHHHHHHHHQQLQQNYEEQTQDGIAKRDIWSDVFSDMFKSTESNKSTFFPPSVVGTSNFQLPQPTTTRTTSAATTTTTKTNRNVNPSSRRSDLLSPNDNNIYFQSENNFNFSHQADDLNDSYFNI